jgi:hypothetical protein
METWNVPARELLAVESDSIRDWYMEHALVAGACRVAALGDPTLPPYSGKVDPRKYPSAAVVSAVFARDGYRCRYCQRPVVHEKLLRALQSVVGKAAFPMALPTSSYMAR